MVNKINVRKAKMNDLKGLVKLGLEEEKYFKRKEKEDLYAFKNKESHKKIIKETINTRNRLLLIAEINKKSVGYLYGSIIESPKRRVSKKGILDDIFVTKNYRGQGVANKLIKFFYSHLEKNKIKYIILFVEKNNKKALKIYKKWGFKEYYLELLKKLK